MKQRYYRNVNGGSKTEVRSANISADAYENRWKPGVRVQILQLLNLINKC